MAENTFYGMGNDYMFRAVLQKSQNVLKKLITELLQLEPKDISHVLILNPIELGNSIGSKDCVLDLEVEIDHTQVVNLV